MLPLSRLHGHSTRSSCKTQTASLLCGKSDAAGTERGQLLEFQVKRYMDVQITSDPNIELPGRA